MAVYEATNENFDELVQTHYAVVDCYGTHCGPCKMLAPIFNDASNDLAMIRFIKVNVDQQREVGRRFHITAVPTLLFFRDGQLFFEDCGGKDQQMLYQCVSKLLYD